MSQSYSTSEAAQLLGVSPATLRRYITSGQLPEPGWTKRGMRKQREYSQSWVDDAIKWLQRV